LSQIPQGGQTVTPNILSNCCRYSLENYLLWKGARLKTPLILIIDDDETARSFLVTCLEGENFRTAQAIDGRSGFSAYVTEKPDLVLTDLRMPNIDGLELTREIRNFDSNIPIVVMSGFDFKESDVISAGANHTCTKPIEVDDLVELVSKALAGPRQNDLKVMDG